MLTLYAQASNTLFPHKRITNDQAKLLYCRSRLLKLWVATPFGVAKCNFRVAKQIGLANQIQKFFFNFIRKSKV